MSFQRSARAWLALGVTGASLVGCKGGGSEASLIDAGVPLPPMKTLLGGGGSALGPTRWYGAEASDGTFWFLEESPNLHQRAALEPLLQGVVSLDSHPSYACAVFTDDVARCKVAATPFDSTEPPFEPEPGPPDAIQVAEGCVLTSSGAVWCFDADATGHPGAAAQVSLPGPATKIAGGGSEDASRTNCSVLASGSLACWGASIYGPFDPSTCPNRQCAESVVPNLDQLVDVTMAEESGCALRSDGAAFCWGFLFETELDGGADDYAPVPVATDLVFDQVSTGGLTTCARTLQGAVACWGVVGRVTQPVPQLVPGLDHVVRVVAATSDEAIEIPGQAGQENFIHPVLVAYALRDDGVVLLIAAAESGYVVQPAVQ